MKNDGRLRVRFALAAGLLLILPAGLDASTLSMSEFLALQPRWKEFAESGQSLRIEGRVASAGRKLIRMRHCPIDFRPSGSEFAGFDPDAIAIEVAGRLERRADKFIFIVSELREPPSDAEVYALRAAALDVNDFGDWYELADWANQRGTFYNDSLLLKKAKDARGRGITLERRAAADDPHKLEKLAEKADSFGLDDLEPRLRHESLRVRWRQMQQDAKADWDSLLKMIVSDLPGADNPLAEWPEETNATYAADAVGTYDAADATRRKILERLFFAEVQRAALDRLAVPSGANGEHIADRLAASLPERPDLARQYRDREMEYRQNRITQSTRAEALLLADRLRSRDRADEATAMLKAWLAAREAAAQQDGPAELARVAEDYADLLNDKATAARLLVDLLKKSPESAALKHQLRQLGYVELGGEWLTRAEAATRPVDPVLQAMREGRVAVNMTPDQVRRTLGKPDRIARAAASAQVHEVWTYGHAGQGGLAVHFQRYSGRSTEAATVTAVSGLAR